MIDAGHTPAQAEHWAARLPTWHTAPIPAATAFAHANAALWHDLAANDQPLERPHGSKRPTVVTAPTMIAGPFAACPQQVVPQAEDVDRFPYRPSRVVSSIADLVDEI